MLYNSFASNMYTKRNTEFFAVHDCFATTVNKVEALKGTLVGAYIDIYSKDDGYLKDFDDLLWDALESSTDESVTLDRENLTVTRSGKEYLMHSVDWVNHKVHVRKSIAKKIDSQYTNYYVIVSQY